MAFVSTFVPAVSAVLRRGAPARVSTRAVARSASTVTMRASKSVPFMEVPPVLAANPSMPGNVEFDPLNISAYLPITWLQEAEIKHGRVCMLACLGLLVQEFFTFPFYKNAPHLATSGHDYAVKVGGMVHILMAVIIWEALTTPAVVQMINGGDRKPGYFGFDPLNLGKTPRLPSTR
eukprot:TRINITY_DN46_c0_g1_i15.p1 TRINITY_DN46_c0_g1~~TRINITY_DN46_c0_g1_i15.p1  ORF type:complete len:195 (+),score=53.17 TRINITY_DN46_c0_g1_i15:55-585(+)